MDKSKIKELFSLAVEAKQRGVSLGSVFEQGTVSYWQKAGLQKNTGYRQENRCFKLWKNARILK